MTKTQTQTQTQTESLGDLFARIVRETVTVATRTGIEAHAAVHGDRQTFCGADTARMMELYEGWDNVTCAKCAKRVHKNIAAAMKYGA